MGVVLLARDTKLGRLVAIKLLRRGSTAASRLLAEGQATARVRHDNIVVIHDVDEIDGHPYMVLEYIEGRTLRQVLCQRSAGADRGLPVGQSVDIIVSVLRALGAAHALGLVHRDIKPENIMLLDSGQVKVLDFGLAQGLDLETGRRRAGTRPYMSPEQANGGDIDARSDIWSAGVLLYELLTGSHPLAPLSSTTVDVIADPSLPMPRLRDKRPDFAGLSDVIERCLRKPKEERVASAEEFLALLKPWMSGSMSKTEAESEHPFAGLLAFQEFDAGRFFGRDRDIAAVVEQLRREALVTVAGPSGAGKSSFVRAGVIAALRRSGEDWEVFVARPGRAPLSVLRELAGLEGDEVDLRATPGLFGAALRARCKAAGREHRILVFVDQFEELFTQLPSPEEHAAFLACLLGAADDASSPLRVLIALRSDFLDRLASDRMFTARRTAGLFFLPPMGRDGLRDALVCPLVATGYQFESDALVEDILDELGSAKAPLPLLQFCAAELWLLRDTSRRLLTRSSYEELGGVAGALSTHAEAVLAGLGSAAQQLCRALFQRLVTADRTRAIIDLQELASLSPTPGEVESLVQDLVNARLLMCEAPRESGSAMVEIVHESLIERWPRLSRWLEESAEDADFLARLRAAASQWEAAGRSQGLLWRERAAEDAKVWYERRRESGHAPIHGRESSYLEAVIALLERGRRRQQRLLVGALAVVTVFASVVVVLGMNARTQAGRADEEAARVRAQNAELALQALRGRNVTRILAARKHMDNPTLALSILREVEPEDIPSDWPDLISKALSSGVAVDVRSMGAQNPIYAAASSPDGRLIALAMNDGTVRILGSDLSDRLTLRGHETHVWAVGFSPDSRRVISASGDKTARIWSLDGSGEVFILRGHEGELRSAFMSRDGTRAVTASEDKTVRVWRASDGRPLATLRYDADICDVAFSPDGRLIAAALVDGTAQIRSADGDGAPVILRGHVDQVIAIAFHPDGSRVVTGGRDKTVRVWDARSGAELLVLRGHEDKINSVDVSPDGALIASSSKDNTARVWNADGEGDPIVLRGHENWVYAVRFGPDSRRLVTSSLDTTVRTWDLGDIRAPKVLRGHQDTLSDAAWSPDSKRIVTASSDGTARIWSVTGRGAPLALRGHTGIISSSAWSPGGERIVTGSDDRTARIWSSNGSSAPVVLRGHLNFVRSAQFSPDGQSILTGSRDGTLKLWSLDGTLIADVKVFEPGKGTDLFARFDSTGRRALVVSIENNEALVRRWAVDDRELVMLGRHEGLGGTMTVVSADDRFLTVSTSGAAWLWNLSAGAPLATIRDTSRICDASFSPDGRQVALAIEGGVIRLWSEAGLGALIPVSRSPGRCGPVLWSVDGSRFVTSFSSRTALVSNTDGSGQPFVLTGPDAPLQMLLVSPDGAHIAARFDDKALRIWTDIKPFSGPGDARLWAATSYCVPAAARVELQGVSDAEASEAYEICVRRAADARRALKR